MIGKRLKKRHNLLEDTRQSLYQEVTYYLKSIEAKGTRFMGGDEPNLADLAVFGCLSSIDGKCIVYGPTHVDLPSHRN
jgi:microsomal prostaglandin-E synthase 2